MEMKNKIKDYTTEVPSEKTIQEIMSLLAKAKAKGIATEFDDDGQVKAVFFRITVDQKDLTFQLPAKPEKVYHRLYANMTGENTYGKERRIKSKNIAWRIVKDWLEVQLTMIELEQADTAEVFLPYLMVAQNKTLYQGMKENQFLLGSGEK